jgi:hypothetical protein
MANCPANNGIMKSIVKPIAHRMNRKGGGTNADIVRLQPMTQNRPDTFQSMV